ncbi:1,2-phenylacetyl-CoA epoxidase subunit PaaD [Cellulomonas carbonis]|uniref:1,2-phenylacetyl-CoA epoxidase subunit PaaD n=1 Tax=Cellulomonas carbonis TaxID=1386092 RepID=UPI000AF33D26|nr:1,2-phenylacetyl-CoA epoxidase subunit PaaD [Cellulomonas carbonis]GGB96165.1 phenylacetate-CoA oxygenase subunit PaaJ [Cellulomonas carbonis]
MTATRAVPDVARLRAVAGSVPDPEIPVVTLDDLGIVRGVTVSDDGAVEVVLTPTYTGCPATEVIAADVERALAGAGAGRVVVRTVLAPAWTTDWITESGRAKLRAFGIAPPDGTRAVGGPVTAVPLALTARCPRCGSLRTREISRFGSTPCKALWSCRDCGEPFDSFKVLR